ncbi:MAG: hypothetical protein HYV60_02685 [Planctomycetia bacterium]|nr:hypothetical protein [Planctomycetia bacterium]
MKVKTDNLLDQLGRRHVDQPVIRLFVQEAESALVDKERVRQKWTRDKSVDE